MDTREVQYGLFLAATGGRECSIASRGICVLTEFGSGANPLHDKVRNVCSIISQGICMHHASSKVTK
jgi:hypothetical protein